MGLFSSHNKIKSLFKRTEVLLLRIPFSVFSKHTLKLFVGEDIVKFPPCFLSLKLSRKCILSKDSFSLQSYTILKFLIILTSWFTYRTFSSVCRVDNTELREFNFCHWEHWGLRRSEIWVPSRLFHYLWQQMFPFLEVQLDGPCQLDMV